MKNSTMILQAIQNNPKDLDAYRAYADALMEEGEEEKGKFLASKLGKPARRVAVTNYTIDKKTTFPFTDLARLIIPSPTSWTLTIKNGFVVRIHMPLFDFMLVYKVLFSRQPIQGVQLTDRFPRAMLGKAFWSEGFEQSGNMHSLYTSQFRQRLLPKEILARFPIDTPLVNMSALAETCYRFDTVKKATQAVSVACVSLGREKAGLVRLPENFYAKISPVGIANWLG